MKIGIFSGTFDPFTNGHLWLVEEGLRLFDEMHVLVGSHPRKKPAFSQEERLQIVKKCVNSPRATFGILNTNVVVYAQNLLMPNVEVFILRGMRDASDFEYEMGILRHVHRLSNKVHPVFLCPPEHLSNVSSTYIKGRARLKNWKVVEQHVPKPVLESLKGRYVWLVLEKEVASIFETGTAGFAPTPYEDYAEIYDPVVYDPLEKTKNFFDMMVKQGFVKYEQTVKGDQVREMLDPIDFDIVVSDTFSLELIRLDWVEPTGTRYLAQSQSLGPIIVESNDTGELPMLGPRIIIEGKHRYLDLLDKGETKCLAWVGDKVTLPKDLNF